MGSSFQANSNAPRIWCNLWVGHFNRISHQRAVRSCRQTKCWHYATIEGLTNYIQHSPETIETTPPRRNLHKWIPLAGHATSKQAAGWKCPLLLHLKHCITRNLQGSTWMWRQGEHQNHNQKTEFRSVLTRGPRALAMALGVDGVRSLTHVIKFENCQHWNKIGTKSKLAFERSGCKSVFGDPMSFFFTG